MHSSSGERGGRVFLTHVISFAVNAVVQVVLVSDGAIEEPFLLRGRGLEHDTRQLTSSGGDDGVDDKLVRVVLLLSVEHVTHQEPGVVVVLLLLTQQA